MMERRNSGRKPIRGTIRRTFRRCGWIHRNFDVLLVAGVLILGAHFLLNATYAADLRFSSFFAFLCFVTGSIGIFIAAKPHWMRDWIRKIAASIRWRIATAAIPVLFAIASLILLVQLKGAA